MLYEPPPNSTHSRLLAPPPDLSPPRQGTKRRNVEWSDDDGAGFKPGLRFHRIGSQGQLVRQDEADSLYSRNPPASIPQQSYQRHPPRSDPPHVGTNKCRRGNTSQSRAAYSLPHDDQVRPSMLSTSHQLQTPTYHQPSLHRSFQPPGCYTPIQSASTIEEEDGQMGEHPGDYGNQYTRYHGEDNDDAYDGRDYYVEGDYL